MANSFYNSATKLLAIFEQKQNCVFFLKDMRG